LTIEDVIAFLDGALQEDDPEFLLKTIGYIAHLFYDYSQDRHVHQIENTNSDWDPAEIIETNQGHGPACQGTKPEQKRSV
jgi:hypothetical protein